MLQLLNELNKNSNLLQKKKIVKFGGGAII